MTLKNEYIVRRERLFDALSLALALRLDIIVHYNSSISNRLEDAEL